MLREHGPIVGLLGVALALRSFRLADVVGQLIGDECYYVQDARVLLGLAVTPSHLPVEARSGLDPNPEHPPLAKLIMAGSMKLLGNREVAWRLPSVLLGALAIWLLYRIVLRLGGTRQQAWFAAFVLAFENLSFIHGRIAMLEIYLVAFTLLATWLYLSSRFELAGVAFGLAMLCKLNGALGLGAVLLFDGLSARSRWRTPAWPAIGRRALSVGFCLAFFLMGLGALDGFFSSLVNPVAHLVDMIRYHAHLTHAGLSAGGGSSPLEWWANSGAMGYLDWKQPADGATTSVLFQAAMNVFVIIAAPFALLLALQQLGSGQASRLATFAVASVAANYLPLLAAWLLVSRTTYIYYMVAVVPGMACALTVLAWAVPRSMRWAYAGMVVFAFTVGFPFRYF